MIWRDSFRFSRLRQKVSLDEKTLSGLGITLSHKGFEGITFLGGEPFLNPHLLKAALSSKESGIATAVVTNGTLIKESDINSIVNEGLFDTMIFSLDGPESVHDQIRGKKGAFRDATENIKRIQRLRKSLKKKTPKIYLYMTLSKYNYLYIRDLADIARKLDAHAMRVISASHLTPEIVKKSEETLFSGALGTHSYAVPESLSIPAEKLSQVRETLLESGLKSRQIGMKWIVEQILLNGKNDQCAFIGNEIVISNAGEVLLCPMLTGYTLGNILKTPLEHILNSKENIDKLTLLKKLVREKSLPVCRECCVDKLKI